MSACNYGMAWTYCRSEAEPGSTFCAHHQAESQRQRCWCGAPSSHQCCAASSFVCGAALCPEHECFYTACGMTGSYGNKHSERGFKQHEEWVKARALDGAKERENG